MRLLPPLGTANLALPCGKCIGCRKRRARDWALRCVHEASHHEHKVFVTLTYDPEHYPANGFLQPQDLRKFLMRVRNALRRRTYPDLLGDSLRYFAVGEYGERTKRAHYHALLFGVDFADRKELPTRKKRSFPIYNSDTLRKLWGLGAVSFAPFTTRTAAYAAQYSVKKQRRSEWKLHDENGEVAPMPFMRCSTNPGIGFWWLWRYGADTQHGSVHHDGQTYSLPRYYKTKMALDCPDMLATANANAKALGIAAKPHSLAAAERIAQRKADLQDPRNISDL